MASEPAEPTTRPQDELIEKAARAMRNRWSIQTPPTEENYADARAVALHGLLADPERIVAVDAYRSVVVALKGKETALEEIQAVLGVKLATGEPYSRLAEVIRERLADPAQTTELARLRTQVALLGRHLQSSADKDKRIIAWRVEAEQAHQNWEGARAANMTALETIAELRTERDALSLLLRGMARKLVAYRKWMSGDDVPVVHRLRREAEERQARIDAALVECDREYPIGRVPIDEVPSSAQICDRIRAALVDDQPTAHALIEERDDAAEDVDHG